MELVDTHCHLQFEPYEAHEDEVLAGASRQGVKQIICVSTTLADSAKAVELAGAKKGVWAAVGSHPHEASSFLADPNSVKKLKKLAEEPGVVAIGEVGLDFYRNLSKEADQEQSLRIQLEVAAQLNLPIIFHVRDAWSEFWKTFDEYKPSRGVIHSFSAHQNQLSEVLKRNLYVGLNGIMTFTKDDQQLEAARAVPLDRLLIETDAPFLTPAPVRKELCEPRHVRITAEFLAHLRGESIEELAKVTTANARTLFRLPA